MVAGFQIQISFQCQESVHGKTWFLSICSAASLTLDTLSHPQPGSEIVHCQEPRIFREAQKRDGASVADVGKRFTF